MGHEISGVVDQVGEHVAPALLGRSVVVNPLRSCQRCPACRSGRDNLCAQKALIGCVPDLPGGLADHVVVPATSAVPWGGRTPLAWGAFVEPLAVGLHAAEVADLSGQRVLVLGGGAIGVSSALAARRTGASSTTVITPDRRRRALIETLELQTAGTEVRLPPRADVVIDCIASSETLALAMDLTIAGGTNVVVGFARTTEPIALTPLVQGERVLHGSAQYSTDAFRRSAQWLESGELDLSALLSPPYPLTDAAEIFRRLSDRSPVHVRTIISP
jgi:threonine dehydrogenase-like Zn-dependent dehydrogenase